MVGVSRVSAQQGAVSRVVAVTEIKYEIGERFSFTAHGIDLDGLKEIIGRTDIGIDVSDGSQNVDNTATCTRRFGYNKTTEVYVRSVPEGLAFMTMGDGGTRGNGGISMLKDIRAVLAGEKSGVNNEFTMMAADLIRLGEKGLAVGLLKSIGKDDPKEIQSIMARKDQLLHSSRVPDSIARAVNTLAVEILKRADSGLIRFISDEQVKLLREIAIKFRRYGTALIRQRADPVFAAYMRG